MRAAIARDSFHALKSFLKVLLCIVLVVSLCPPMTGAFAVEKDDVAAQVADGQDLDNEPIAGDAGEGMVSDGDGVAGGGETPQPADPATAIEAESGGVAAEDALDGDDALEGADDPIAETEAGDDGATEGDASGAGEAVAVEPEATVLKAEADAVYAELAVDADVALPAGAKLVVTPLVKHEAEEADADTDDDDASCEDADDDADAAAAADEGADEDADADLDTDADADTDAALVDVDGNDDGDVDGDEDDDEATSGEDSQESADASDGHTMKGSDVVLAGMTDAVKAYRQKKNEDAAFLSIVDAYSVEVLDGHGELVHLDNDQAKLTFVKKLSDDDLDGVSVYAVDRWAAGEDATGREAAAAKKPVSEVAEDEFADEAEAAEVIVYDGEAADVTKELNKDEKSGEATIELEGAQDVVLTRDVLFEITASGQAIAVAKSGAKSPLRAPSAEWEPAGPTGGKPSGKLAKEAGATIVDNNGLGIKLNLFDYDARDAAVWGRNENNFGNLNSEGINNGQTNDDRFTKLQFYANGTQGYGINNFAGYAIGDNAYQQQYAMQGIVKSELKQGSDGGKYPELNTGGGNLEYLFSPKTNATGVSQKHQDVSGLFYLTQEGSADEMMTYNSNKTYAYYDAATNSFKVYNDTYYRYSGSAGTDTTMPIGFFPFDEYNGATSKPGAYINPTQDGWNLNNHVNHHFGMTMEAKITMPYNGQIYHEASGSYKDMVFKFSGDDDMWVFIDGKLALDVGGIHQPVEGTINFHTGEVRIASGVNNRQQDSYTMTARTTNDQNGAPVTTTADDAKVRGDVSYLWGKNADGQDVFKNGSTGNAASIFGDQWRAGSEHTIQFFYLERGGCDSNLEISTNIHLMAKRALEVSKRWDTSVAEADKVPVSVQLIRQATERDDATKMSYAIVETQELNSGNGWKHSWSDLLTEGYNATGIYDEAPGATNAYCDYKYFVREVPVGGFDPLYSEGNSPNLDVREVTYTENGTSATGKAAPVDSAFTPMKITNVPTTIEVEKKWLNEEGTATDTADHSADAVYVQLYKQTRADATSDWTAEEAVGDPVALNAAGGFKHTFKVADTGDNVRYLVKEGTMQGSAFTPKTTLSAAGKDYAWVSTKYKSQVASIDDDGENVKWTDKVDNASGGIIVPEHGRASAVISNKPVVKADITLKKVSAKRPTDTLSGAKFEVYRDNGDNEFAKADETRFPDATAEYTTGSSGTVQITDLTPGTYWVLETQAPQGYTLPGETNPVKVVVNDDGSVESLSDANAGSPSIGTANGVTTLTVPNMPSYSLPSTSGPGVLSFLFAGAFIMALALGLMRRKDQLQQGMAMAATIARRR